MRYPSTAVSPHLSNVTLGVEYECRSIPHNVANDLECLGFPCPSRRDIEHKAAGTFHITLRCLPTHIALIQSLERGQRTDSSVKKYRCGIKRIWSLTRLHAPYQLAGEKRFLTQNDDIMAWEENASMAHPILQDEMHGSASPSSSESSNSPYTPTSTSEDWSALHRDMGSAMICESMPSPVFPVQISAWQPDRFSLKIQPLNQSDIPDPHGREPAARPTVDPRQRFSVNSASSSCMSSPIEEKHSGYSVGTRLVRVVTAETRPSGSDARLRRLLFLEKHRCQERMKEVERERDDFRVRMGILERECTQACEELKASKGLCDTLEAQMDDVRKECAQPFVVSALLDAFFKIEQLDGRLLGDSG